MSPPQRGPELHFSTADDLISRLSHLHREGRPVVVLVGAPLSAQTGAAHGVPNVAGMIDLIRGHYATTPEDLAHFEATIRDAANPYQAAFSHLHSRRGQDEANQIVRSAVLKAYLRETDRAAALPARMTDEDRIRCQAIERDVEGWDLSPGCVALGQLAVRAPATFGSCILTTNFDPLVQIAIAKAGGKSLRTVLDRDGDFRRTEGEGCHIVHLHGHWYRSDTLHTSIQLTGHRPHLRRSLEALLADRPLVVLAYGGWDDVFNAALLEVLAAEGRNIDLLWTFYGDDANHLRTSNPQLLERLSPGITAGRVHLYKGIDVHSFLPAVVQRLEIQASAPSAPNAVSIQTAAEVPPQAPSPRVSQPESPFLDRGRIKEPVRFFNREALLDKLFQSLRNKNNISLVGETAIGKSSILSMICSQGPARLNLPARDIIYMDMQRIDNDSEFYDVFCGKLGIAPCKGAALAEHVNSRAIVLCLDEIEKMISSGRKGFGHKVRSHLRGMADGGDHPLRLVVASRSSLTALFRDDEDPHRTSPYHNIFLQYSVPPFTTADARQFLRQRLQPTGMSFSPEEEDRLVADSGGHPGKLQDLAHQLFQQKSGQS